MSRSPESNPRQARTTKCRVEETALDILTAFDSGDVPAALAQVFLTRRAGDSRPCDQWSWGNRLIIALRGHADARGFRQWKAVGRHVKRGQRACHILAPLTVKVAERDPETGEEVERSQCVGFRTVPVFGYSQTEGEPLLQGESALLDSLPLLDVARAWGVEVGTTERVGATLGSTDGKTRITLCVQNLATWAHELVHCADSRLRGGLRPGQHPDQEVVAELGGAILLECIGYEYDSDRGGCLDYLKQYAGDKTAAIRACNRLVGRACEAVSLILDAATEPKKGNPRRSGERLTLRDHCGSSLR